MTLRLPANLLASARQLAESRDVSLSVLLRELLVEAARAERERELTRAYEVLGTAANDVGPYFDAQADVARLNQ